MLSLKDREWKEFKIDDIFNVFLASGDTQADKCQSGNYPLISSGGNNNGLCAFIGTWDEKSVEYKPGIITVDMFGKAFTQEFNFYCVSHGRINLLKAKEPINTNIRKFIITTINNGTNNKFSYNQICSSKRLQKLKIMLPVADGSKPDYAFMEQYIQEREQKVIQDYIAYIGKNISIGESITPLNQKEWKEFYLRDIFPNIQRGKRLKTADHILGNIPYVSSSAATNGVDAFIGNTERTRKFSDCLTIANSGSVGKVFYHCYEFIASDHVTALSSPCLNEYIYLFVSAIVERLQEKYSFNREINEARIDKEKIILPVTDDGKPDYAYMEQYSKLLCNKIKLQYLWSRSVKTQKAKN